MIRGWLEIGDEYFHKGTGRWQRKTKRGWIRRSIAVMEEHLGRRLNSRLEHVHHKDNDKTNDALDNLEVKPGGKHISDHRKGHKDSVGVKNNMAKANPKLVRQVRLLSKQGNTQYAIAKIVGLSQPQVHRIIVGKAWVHV